MFDGQSAAAPACGEVHVWQARLSEQRSRLPFLATVLGDQERAELSSLSRPVDREMFTLSRGLRRVLLGDCLEAHPKSLVFECNAHGKPRLVPAASRIDLRFNVSHSGDVVLIAVANENDVGVDVERVREVVGLDALSEQVLSPAQLVMVRKMDGHQRTLWFFSAWARKEALIKAVGLGLQVPLDGFDVDAAPNAPPRLIASRTSAIDVERWSLHPLSVPTGYRAALAAEKGVTVIKRLSLDFAPPGPFGRISRVFGAFRVRPCSR